MNEEKQDDIPEMSLLDITEGENERGIPVAKFIDDVQQFAEQFTPVAPAELLIGAYSELHQKYKTFEAQLVNKQQRLKSKVPELEKSLELVNALKEKKENKEKGLVRYSLADSIFAKAEIDYETATVNLWLGANVMLEYTVDEAIDFLSKNLKRCKQDLVEIKDDLGFVRDQIVTSEVGTSRIFNWDVRRKRGSK